MADKISTLLILIPALPLLSAIVTAVLGPRVLKHASHLPTIFAIIGSCVCALLLVQEVNQQQSLQDGVKVAPFERVYNVWTWAQLDGAYERTETTGFDEAARTSPISNFRIDIALRADALTAMMLAMVTFVSSLVAIFAKGYMHDDRGYWRFFSYISLFVFSMTMLVSVSNFVLLFVFWEAVGVCSYLLIGFWYHKPEAAAAGKKAFLVNRVGDFGFTLAMFLIWITYGTLNFHNANEARFAFSTGPQSETSADDATATSPPGLFSRQRIESPDGYVAGGVGLAICLLLLVGACGKSAQFPLHVWLPDAMEGPTPVSALIHAATMVTAGVYMVARCTPLFMVSPDAQLTVSVIGGFTALLAGLIALTQFDLKRVLAYSTISQLGYMFLALGTGTLAGISAGMFHLFTHAFFKALLFLGAGSVMHAMHHVIDMRRFSGLRHRLPITHATFAIGCLALAGIVPFAGFWSKDAIIGAVHDKVHSLEHHEHADEAGAAGNEAAHPIAASYVGDATRRTVYQILYYSALVTAFLTAFYTFRAFFMTFYGDERIPAEAGDHAHESPPSMWVPLAVLAVCATLVGVAYDRSAFGGSHVFAAFLSHAPSLAVGAVSETTRPGEFHVLVAALSTLVAVAGIGVAAYLYLGDRREIQWIADKMNSTWMFVSPYKLSERKFYLDEIYNALIVWPLRCLAVVCYWFDRWIIDGLVNGCGRIPPAIGTVMRSLQMGLVPFYALAMVLGALILIATRLLWAG